MKLYVTLTLTPENTLWRDKKTKTIIISVRIRDKVMWRMYQSSFVIKIFELVTSTKLK